MRTIRIRTAATDSIRKVSRNTGHTRQISNRKANSRAAIPTIRAIRIRASRRPHATLTAPTPTKTRTRTASSTRATPPANRTDSRTANRNRQRQLAADQPVQTCGGMAAKEGEERDPRHLRNTWHRRHHPRPGTADLARSHAESRRNRTRRILRGFRRGPHCDRNRGTRASGRMART